MMWVLVVAAFVCAGLVPLMLPLLRARAMDVPSHRSSHLRPTPRGGGLAVVGGVLAGCGVGFFLNQPPGFALVIAIMVMTGLGLADDLWNLRVSLRLSLTLVVATVFAASVLKPAELTSWLIVATAAVLISGYTNAFNFMDGVNGISAFNAALAGGWLAFLAHREAADGSLVLALGLTGASLGFLPWNAPRARVFLGDSGSYGVGLAIAGLAMVVWHAGAPLLLAVAPLWIYVIDTFFVFVRRVVSGQRWSEAHRDHVYQRLVDRGLTHVASAAVVTVTGASVCVLTWLSREEPVITVLGALVVAAVYLALPAVLLQRSGGRLNNV